jgi:hypothetical protein
MSKTCVEQTFEERKSTALKEYKNLLVKLVDIVERIQYLNSVRKEAGDIDRQVFDFNTSNLENQLRILCRHAKHVLNKYTAEVGQYELLNDIRLGKVQVVNPETNEPVTITFSTAEV